MRRDARAVKEQVVKENFGAVNIELTPDEMQEIDEALSHMELMNMGRG